MPMADGALSAHALGIAAWERQALIDLVPQLEAGAVKIDMHHVDNCVAEGQCLGAYVARVHPDGLRPFVYVMSRRAAALAPLFAPGFGTQRMLAHPGWDAKARAAAIAVRRFLTGARMACWDGFLGAA